MSSRIRLLCLLGGCAVLGLSACILVPDGHGGDHEDREHHDRGDEHRHDFGLQQREQLGLDTLRDALVFAPCLAVQVPQRDMYGAQRLIA